MKPARAQTLLYIQTTVTLAVSMAILIWLHQIYTNYRDRSLEDMQGLFTRDEILKPRYDINFQFRRVEALAKTVRSSMFVEDIYVVKMLEDRGEHVIHPFHTPVTEPDWPTRVARWSRFPLVQGGEVYGVLYIREDTMPLTIVRVAIGLLGALLLLTLALFMVRLLTQQSQLRGAYVALEEKDRQMIQLERLALAGQLTANILHDIKKPVANIKHTLPELEDGLGGQEGASGAALRNIKKQTDLFFSILKDLGLERFVRSRDQDREYLDLNHVLRQSCALVQYERKAVEIQWDLARTEPPLVLAQPYRLIQVFSNLILNAYQAMEGRGRLTLRTRSEKRWAVVEVIDDGPGVDPAMTERLFDPFESTKLEGEGAGLGLYISRNIMSDLGGTLELAPSETGARFVARLPLAGGE